MSCMSEIWRRGLRKTESSSSLVPYEFFVKGVLEVLSAPLPQSVMIGLAVPSNDCVIIAVHCLPELSTLAGSPWLYLTLL